MRKSIVIFTLILAALFQSCTESVKKDIPASESSNALLPKEVVITYEHNLIVPNQTIFNPINKDSIVNRLIDLTLTGNIPVISAFDDSKLPLSEINRHIGSFQDTITKINPTTRQEEIIANTMVYDRENMQRLVMNERWSFDEEAFSMKKEILKYAPISIFYKNSDSLKTNLIKKMLYWYTFIDEPAKDLSEMELIGKNISYEFELYNGISPKWLESLSVRRFVDILLKRAIDENKNVYDFFDKSPLTPEQIKENLGESKEELYVEDDNGEIVDTVLSVYNYDPEEIMAVIFVEDWYLDSTNLKIYKKVKQIAPVRVFTSFSDKGEEEFSKKIPFILTLN